MQDAQLEKLTTQEREIRKKMEGVTESAARKSVSGPLQPVNGDISKGMAKPQLNGVAKKGKKRKGAVKAEAGAEPASKQKHSSASPAPSLNPNIAAASRAVAESLAIEEAKRKATMSQAVKSLYGTKGSEKKETFMTRGTFTRVSTST